MLIRNAINLKHHKVILIIGIWTLFLGCSASTAITHYFKSTDHFKEFPKDNRIFYEEGGGNFADITAELLPSAIKSIENKQYNHFTKPVKIYICATTESFKDMTGRDVKAITYRGAIFLSPKLMDEQRKIKGYLTHELSHLLINQHGGTFIGAKTPSWFLEGLATYISGGGGAEDITNDKAIAYILQGKHFTPELNGGFIFRKTASSYGLEPHMFYRQAALFIAFMKEYDETSFKKLISGIYHSKSFKKAFRNSYNVSMSQLWNYFILRLKENGKVSKIKSDEQFLTKNETNHITSSSCGSRKRRE